MAGCTPSLCSRTFTVEASIGVAPAFFEEGETRTRTFPVEVTVANPERRLLPAMVVRLPLQIPLILWVWWCMGDAPG